MYALDEPIVVPEIGSMIAFVLKQLDSSLSNDREAREHHSLCL